MRDAYEPNLIETVTHGAKLGGKAVGRGHNGVEHVLCNSGQIPPVCLQVLSRIQSRRVHLKGSRVAAAIVLDPVAFSRIHQFLDKWLQQPLEVGGTIDLEAEGHNLRPESGSTEEGLHAVRNFNLPIEHVPQQRGELHIK